MRYILKFWSVRGKGKHSSKSKILTFLKSAYQKLCKTAWSTQDFLLWEKWATLMTIISAKGKNDAWIYNTYNIYAFERGIWLKVRQQQIKAIEGQASCP